MIMTTMVNSICIRPMATWLPTMNAGTGQCHMCTPIEKYIRTSSTATEAARRWTISGVVLSSRAASSAASFALALIPWLFWA